LPQAPPGAAPAGTMIGVGVPATLKVKFVPTVIPAPATLQIWTNPIGCECAPLAQSKTTDARNMDLTRIMAIRFPSLFSRASWRFENALPIRREIESRS
jgi:hypothetical protein